MIRPTVRDPNTGAVLHAAAQRQAAAADQRASSEVHDDVIAGLAAEEPDRLLEALIAAGVLTETGRGTSGRFTRAD